MNDPFRLEPYITALARSISQKFPSHACDAEDLSQAGRLALVQYQPTEPYRARAIARKAILNEAVVQFFPCHAPQKIKWRAVTARRMLRQGATEQEILIAIGGPSRQAKLILSVAKLIGVSNETQGAFCR